jgi:tetratricopeptide (TPR) repeat protein
MGKGMGRIKCRRTCRSTGEKSTPPTNVWLTRLPSAKFIAKINLTARILFLAALGLAAFASVPAFAQTSSPQAPEPSWVEGVVRDASGKPVATASIVLVGQGEKPFEAKSHADGTFLFPALRPGAFTITPEKAGMCGPSRLLELSAGEKKHVDLVLDARPPATSETSAAGAPDVTGAAGATAHPAPHGCSPNSLEFSDQPNFVIAGIADWSNLGLHGSDATTRTSDALAKETLALKSGLAPDSSANTGADAAAAHRLSGDRDERASDPVAAVREYEQAARLDPSEENYFAWGSELLLHRATQPAAEVFAKGSALHPQSTRMLVGLGAALYANGLRDDAAHRLCQASDLNPADPAPYLFLGKIEDAAADPVPCAEEKLARFAKEQPGNARANYYFALSLWKNNRQSGNSKQFHQTEALLQKAVAIDPALSEGYLQLGILYAAQNDFARAAQFLRQAITANPQLAEAHRRLGQAYQRTGNAAQAEQEFAIYKQCQKSEADALERQRRELRQFLVILQAQPATTAAPH